MFDALFVRQQFPALSERYNGKPAIFFDNPGGTQVHESVIRAMTDYLTRRNANTHGVFATSRLSDETLDYARQAAADLLGAAPEEVIFGANMTTLTFMLSRSLAAEFGPDDEIIVTRLDHDANVWPWVMMAEDTGAQVRWADVDLETCTLDMEHLRSLINERTRLVAVGYASNAVGTINDVKTIVRWAKEAGAYTYIDAVQYAPHGLIDVKALDCDFLACSAYKFFGPHIGLLYGKREHLERLRAYRVRPAGEALPGKWETGTKNHEGMAGAAAAIDYIASLGATYGRAPAHASRREKLAAAWEVIGAYEYQLMDRLLTGLKLIPRVRIYGITDRMDWDKRLATVSIRKEGLTPEALALKLAEENIFVWNGNFYAVSISERLGVEESGGLVRIGLVHYNTLEEVDRCLTAIDRA
ncbi:MULTISPECIES: cysteine desulfurase-like protein [Caldilinea]|jgi:cysteine desulfurase family protein (TIGR01976 family)|uniref:Cysteine desulphurase family protein n=1 Tax=Caldilinea aerophila (strain DSM 14535 / JCM 11387 / NBRC 104270 / STL-6-O1) TaxID=926550 RepID=I0HYG0_CALAS|nr:MULTISPECIES: cysteine desulfurase-like protein [Caldilinea]MBO9391313.1 cysteine desulfurase-like protein [Caldilinea sp.]BAL98047.1 cysteine desulphurase family protein [Caldilinea aerophila DSM 14535 = NBRC 104270]GIV75366.1 MAG: cysteine desulfurase-like protein [Caldilinea sp.]